MKKKHNLSQKTIYSTVKSCILFGFVTLLIALIFYGYTLTKKSIRNANSTAKTTLMSVRYAADPIPLSDQVMSIYRGLSEEQRQQCGSAEYRQYFADVDRSEGSSYNVLIKILRMILDAHDELFDVYLAMYDEDTQAIVYIADPDGDSETALMPGDWETVNEKGLDKFLNWDGGSVLYDIGNTENYGLLCTVGIPITNEAGEKSAFVLVDLSLDNIRAEMKEFTLMFSLAMLLLTVLISLVQAIRIKRKLVTPINMIADASERFADPDRAKDPEQEIFANLDIHTGDELEELVHTMSGMEHGLKEYGRNLLKITAEKERISTELSLAKEIQFAMLPHIFPPFPNRNEFDIYAEMNPAREVGGDFYDFFLIDEDHLCLVMADVSGKGVPAALFMMISKTILQSCAMLGNSPADILSKTNEGLCSNNQVEMFVTVWLGILEISTGKLVAANAGHEYPILKQNDGQFVLVKDKHSFAVGGMDGIRYKEYEIMLQKGDQLFLYTDGVTEAEDPEQKMFGEQRLIDALNSEPRSTPKELLRNVRMAVSSFVSNAEQFDDLTMLCMEYKGRPAESADDRKPE